MITPLMLILSCINDQYNYDTPVDISFLNREDRVTINSEANRLGILASDSLHILTTTGINGEEIADSVQMVNEAVIDIHPGTAMMLTRIKESFSVWKKSKLLLHDHETDKDLSIDNVIMHLEGNPWYIYSYVYQTMENRSSDYDAKMAKILELYTTIISNNVIRTQDGMDSEMIRRLTLQSTQQFWSGLIEVDLMRHMGMVCEITPNLLSQIKQELSSLGFYGFVNPLKMYLDFSGSRVWRKTDINIAPEVLEFLTKVVRSGG